ncbi:hypothetical protein [uncultured Williamsia sp.]|uniref:hypothetical protein n=1 Tax=uncultured Williamsia sp. TaxID=259311 RepID=UPI002629C3B9|nr:hypothetical protein [uncultured Williamsia sp.]
MDDLRAAPPPASAVEVQVLGKQIVNGLPVRSTRPLEFVTALAWGGGEASLTTLRTTLFGGCAGRSAVATLAYRARRMGVETVFDRYRDSYRLTGRVTVDVLEMMAALRDGDHRLAIWLYEGPYLPASRTPMATRVREILRRRVREATDTVDPDLRDRYVARFRDLLDVEPMNALDELVG